MGDKEQMIARAIEQERDKITLDYVRTLNASGKHMFPFPLREDFSRRLAKAVITALEQAPEQDQDCYDLGYNNPAKSFKEFSWKHVVLVNAFHAGQMDHQNQILHNSAYNRDDYDAITGERVSRVILGWGEWQPMDTAPKNGTQVLLCSEHRTLQVAWWANDGWAYGGGKWADPKIVTHWMPLPYPVREEKD